MILTCEEIRGFAEAMKMYGEAIGDTFYSGVFMKAHEIINMLCDELYKEKGEGKKKNPPTPPIKKKARVQEKTTTTTTRAHTRVREGCSYVGPLWEEVLRYVKRAKIDADYALWWYGQMDALGWCNPDCIEEPIGNWKQLLRGWWRKRGKSNDDWKRPVEKLPRKYSAAEWCLCAERCSHFDAKLCRCRSGCAIPPEHREHPIAPEECERYNNKEVK